MLLVALFACHHGRSSDAVLDATDVDECGALCGTWDGGGDITVESSLDSVVYDGPAGDFCTSRPLTVGVHHLTLAHDGDVEDLGDVTVHPFGWDHGLDKPLDTLTEVPWTPVVDGLDDPPLLMGDRGGWDGAAVMAPAIVHRDGLDVLYYAGTDEEFYHLGIATRPVGTNDAFTKSDANPVLYPGAPGAQQGEWDNFAQNTPEPVETADGVRLYYTGQAGPTGHLSIGTASSEDGLAWTEDDNPTLGPSNAPAPAWDGDGIAHPSVNVRDGVWEMWYASGTTFSLGIAISDDGRDWTPYCKNPIFAGQGEDTWDEAHVKSPEVVYDGETYFMSYSGCGKGCYQIGWAASSDGIRWVAAPDPIIPFTGTGWNAQATREGYVDVDPDDMGSGSTWTFWYTGNDGYGIERIGKVTAVRP